MDSDFLIDSFFLRVHDKDILTTLIENEMF